MMLQHQAEFTLRAVARVERRYRHYLSVYVLIGLHETLRCQFFRQHHTWVESMHVWHLHSMEVFHRRGVVSQARLSCQHIGFLRREFTQRVYLQGQEREDRDGVLLLSLQSECSAAKAEMASHEQLRRSMYAFAFKREMYALQVIHQPTQNLGIYQQTITGRGTAPTLQTLRTLGQQQVTPRLHHGSNPML